MFLRDSKKKRERIIALDLLRGTFLIVIFVNHIGWSPTLFDIFTGRSHLFASAAEGFFAISGVLVGYIYGPRILKKTKETFTHLLRRAGWLYILSISFTFLYVFLSLFVPPGTLRQQPGVPDLMTLIISNLTLQYDYGWADFLSRYAVLMVLAPFALWVVAKGRWWLAALISVAVWATVGQTFYSAVTAWQLIFVGGIIIGYYLPQIEETVKSFAPTTKRYLSTSLFTVALSTFVVSVVLTIVLPTVLGEFSAALSPTMVNVFNDLINFRFTLDHSIFDRDTLAIGRIIIGTIWFASLYIIYRRYENKINSATKGTLLLLGTNSLYVYGLQAFILFMMDIFLAPPADADIILKTLITMNAVYLVYLATKHRASLRGLRRKIIRV